MKNEQRTMNHFNSWINNSAIKKVWGILLALIILVAVLGVVTDSFLTSQNIFNVTRQVAVNIFLTCGMTMAILIAGIDLSVGSIIAVSACLCCGLVTNNGLPVGLAILLAIGAGTLVGAFNGFIISSTKIPPFIVTLGTMNICRGFVRIYTDMATILVRDETFTFIGTGKIVGGLPVQIIFIAIVIFIAWLILYRSKFGRHIFAVGDNEQAAVFSGINVRKTKFLVYTLVGLFAACAGILSAARTHSALFNVGEGYEMDAISAVVLGGTSMSGGVGTLGGSIIGALVIGVITNGMNLIGIDSSWQYVVKGCVLLLAVYLDYLRKKRYDDVISG